jgi:hypothetical protein
MSALTAGWNQPPGLPQADPRERIGHRGPYRGTAPSVPLRSEAGPVLSLQNRTRGTLDTMTTRSAAIATIALIVVLSAVLALAGMLTGEINERAHDIATTVILGFGGITAGLLVYLRLETLSGKADEAAIKAALAAEKAAVVENKVERVHHDILNGGLRENVKKAISEDRHALKNREAAAYAREQLEARGMPRRDHGADE